MWVFIDGIDVVLVVFVLGSFVVLVLQNARLKTENQRLKERLTELERREVSAQ